MIVAANTHRAVSYVDPLGALNSTRAALEGSSDFWAFVIQLATVAITVGVFVEVVATILEIIEDRAEGKKLPVHAMLTLFGGAVVAVALAFEFWAESKSSSTETKLRANNAAAQSELDKRAREATAQAVAIAGKFGGLQKFVARKEGEMDTAFSGFRAFAEQQQTLTTHAISDLNNKQTQLQTALSSVDTSAGKAASAADTANKTAASMTDTLNSERQMSAQMRALVTPRVIDDSHFSAMVDALKAYPKTPVDLGVTRDPECADLLVRISDALVAAKWDIRAWQGTGFSLRLNARPDLPPVGEITGRGVGVSISLIDQKLLGPAGDAFLKALRDAGLLALPGLVPDKLPDGKPNPAAVTPGILHITVGSRS